MRQKQTEVEIALTESITEAFRRDGCVVELPLRAIYDKPDILIKVNSVLVACECTQIPPADVYHGHVKRTRLSDWAGFDLQTRIWPNEPHIWLANAIKDKSPKVTDYLTRTSAQEAWLLVHSPLASKQFFVRQDKEWVFRALEYGAKMNTHRFSRVLLWTPLGGIQTLFAPGLDNPDTCFDVDFQNGHPTHIVTRGHINFRTLAVQASSPCEIRHNHKTRKSTVIAAQDPEYAMHKPAIRDAHYEFRLQIWSDRAIFQSQVTFEDTLETFPLRFKPVSNLEPDTPYSMHYLHEYAAPKRLTTTHQRPAPMLPGPKKR